MGKSTFFSGLIINNRLQCLQNKTLITLISTSLGVFAIIPLLFGNLIASASPTITEYPTPTPNSGPTNIVSGSDGALWFVEGNISGSNQKIGRITTSGSATEYTIPSAGTSIGDIAAGSDGALWFTEPYSGSEGEIGRISTSGAITQYRIPTYTIAYPNAITAGPDGALWFTTGTSYIGRITTSGVISWYSGGDLVPNDITTGPDGALWYTEGSPGNDYIGTLTTTGTETTYSVPNPAQNSIVRSITTGPDGSLWFTYGNTGQSTNQIGRITTLGSATEYNLPTANDGIADITKGPDGALWFTEGNTNQIGRMTTLGSVSEYPIPTAGAYPFGITTGPDGALWFGESGTNQIGRLNPTMPPSAPTNLTAPSPTNAAPSLSWTAVTGATSYNIYRNGVNIGSSTTNSYSDTSTLTSGTTYAYCVTAVNSSGESSCSNTINVEYYTTDPTLTYTLTPVPDSNGYNTGNVLVTVNCSSAVGIHDQTPDPSTTVPDEGIGQTVSASCTDNAGNTTMENINPSLLVSAIAAGNNDGAVPYSSDTGYSGGSTYSSSANVDISQVLNPAPQSVYQNSRYGNNFTYTFSGLTPGSNYTLRLDFNELYFGTAQSSTGGIGSRVFNVDVNGSSALSNFDIYAAAGGSNKAIAEQIPTTADSNGNVTVTFSAVTDNALVNGLELFNGTLPGLAPIPQATSAYIAAGSPTAIGNFSSDNDYSGGTAYNTSNTIDTSGVSNAAPEAVWQNDRYGTNFTYTVPNLVPNTNYNVQLDFDEPFWTAAGQRLFNVTINGDQVLTNFDIFATAESVYNTTDGSNKAIAENFTATSDSNGRITINFAVGSGGADKAVVSGVEVSEE